MKNEFIVRFVLRKGEGNWPTSDEIGDDENLCDIATFNLVYEPDDETIQIETIDVLYDGITWLDYMEMGMISDQDNIEGFPSPILRFRIDQPMDEYDFVRSVNFSSVGLLPRSRDKDDSYFCEDHQGYTGTISGDDLDLIIDEYKNLGISGKFGLTMDDFTDGIKVSDMIEPIIS
jgi:hypothetical protein